MALAQRSMNASDLTLRAAEGEGGQFLRIPAVIAWACLLVSASCLPSAPRGQGPRCPEPALTEARVREIGYAAARSHFKDLPNVPAEVRLKQSGCKFAYMEIYDESIIGAFVTVLISSDGRVLAVAPGL